MSYDKKLTLQELFLKKQKEYLDYYLRWKLYEKPAEKAKMKDICVKIKETIDDIAFKNLNRSIFSSQNLLEKRISEFLNESGMPNISYRDDYQKKMKGFWDKYYLFKPEKEVEYEGKLCKIKESNCKFPPVCFFDDKIVIEFDNLDTKLVNIDEIKLIELNELFKEGLCL